MHLGLSYWKLSVTSQQHLNTLNDANETSQICTGINNLYKKHFCFSKCIGMYFFFKLLSSSFYLESYFFYKTLEDIINNYVDANRVFMQ